MGPADTWDALRDFLQSVPDLLPVRPSAILLISGHYESDVLTLTSGANPSLFFDYYGFPPHTYELEYPAPGSPGLAQRAADMLGRAGIATRLDPSRGFDHGVFIPLKVMFPDADVPIVMLSMRHDLDPGFHLEVGRVLAPLRDDNVLILGSGLSYHNMNAFMTSAALNASKAFDNWLRAACAADPATRRDRLAHWESAPSARAAHPREEHLLPLMVCAGAGLDDPGSQPFAGVAMNASISAFAFGLSSDT